MTLLPLIQSAYFSVWGSNGSLLVPVFWGILAAFFYSNKSPRWLLVIICGVVLGWQGNLFGVDLISLSLLGMVFSFILGHWLIHKNFVGWLIAGLLGLPFYLLTRTLVQRLFDYSVDKIWSWYFNWQQLFYFIIFNLIALIICYYFISLFRKYFKHGQS